MDQYESIMSLTGSRFGFGMKTHICALRMEKNGERESGSEGTRERAGEDSLDIAEVMAGNNRVQRRHTRALRPSRVLLRLFRLEKD